ncbi:NUDIX domain-containing protein [Oceaniradius stylonematis]|uniref:NUDIX domain-containing protein n=1 Tax=Oceaniradius stylonematis TaxID=2184161 RepID=A0A3A8ACF7_9HYPH|nr:NUDIX hydrolase [Oceaniradius stylonematis]RKF07545.1 NUDIX domain-containing protein [Oceaniradius stylonematis]
MTGRLDPLFSRTLPEGDTHQRDVCDHCGFVAYENPKIVVGSVVTHRGKVLLCRRAIEPRHGYWTVPAGYLELGETPEEGARREAREEANADLELHGLLAVYTVRRLSQVQLIYRATLADGVFSPGIESLETQLFDWDAIPWDDLAFPTVHWMLGHQRAFEAGKGVGPFGNPVGAD